MTEELKKEFEDVQKFLAKEESKQTIAVLVSQFKEVFGNQWFSLEDCSNVFKTASIAQLVDIIRTLDLCGFIVTSKSTGKKKNEVEKYRISNNSVSKLIHDI